ncbi:unnamed protein product [Cyprideis torosa]|uniref:Serine-threonine kinase receptor-associated protein n=1 Tax=Cyprideis torosa TaxID=163714 RepID=A0A7R8W6C4_9CRUS|nr:unnamed protein product [Cyprideis torosa]CAG0886274.1 unnamed protein product [Cyprideis torosa]
MSAGVGVKQVPLTCSGHTRPVVHLAFSDITEKGYFLISACKDGKPMLRQGDTGDWIGTFEGHKGAVWGVCLTRDASLAATGAADYTAKIWNANTGDEVKEFSHKHIVKTVEFSRDGRYLLTGGNEKSLRIFDLQNQEVGPVIISAHSGAVRQALFTPDQRGIISCADDCSLKYFDVASGQEVRQAVLPRPLGSLELDPDGRLITLAYGNCVGFFNVERFEKIREIQIPAPVNSASLHPQKSVFVCGGEDFKAYKFDYTTGNEIESFKGHFGPIHCVRFSPDGELYASGSEDGTVRLWQTTVGKSYGLWKCVDGEGAPIVPTANDLVVT